MAFWPFTLSGGGFLLFYVVLILLAVFASLLFGRWLRPEGRSGRIETVEQAAFLAGGKTRLAESATTRLLVARALSVADGKRLAAAAGSSSTSAVERKILSTARPASWNEIESAIRIEADRIGAELVRKGLLIDRATALRFCALVCAPLVIVVATGLVRLSLGLAHDRPVGFLVVLLLFVTVITAVRFAKVERLTRAGKSALAEQHERNERLRRAPMQDEYATAVALFGIASLAGSDLSDFHDLRRENGGGDSGGGDGGDGGCGGGGCGGCGG